MSEDSAVATQSYHLETYGCTLNKFDSELMETALQRASLRRVDGARDADIVIVNTCAVKQQTEDKVIFHLKRLSRLDKKLIVTGCLPAINRKRLLDEVRPDVVAGVSVGEGIVDLALGNNRKDNESQSLPPLSQRQPNSRVIHITATGSGCLGSCSFCGTKAARGTLKSYPQNEILADVRRAVRSGAKEVWLTGVDLGPYAQDLRDGTSLVSLLRLIGEIGGYFRVRVGMANPRFLKGYLDELVRTFTENRKLFDFLHIPVQSGSDEVLRVMQRGHTAGDYIDIVQTVRKELGERFTIATDIIVGHPGERESDFEDTLDVVRRTEPDVVNVSKFFPRPGTRAKQMKRVPTETIKERSIRLTRLVHEISWKRNSMWLGWRGRVLVDERGKEGMVGRNYAYKPVVLKDDWPIGQVVPVRIVDAATTWILGHPLS